MTTGAVVMVMSVLAFFAGNADACSYGPVATATFEGTISRIDKRTGTATFTVDHVESTEQAKPYSNRPPAPPDSMPVDSGEVAVRYLPEQVVELHDGESYHVIATTFPGPDSYWSSTAVDHIATWENMCDSEDEPARTTLVNGSAIEKPIKTFDRRIAATDPRTKLAVGVVAIALGGAMFLGWRRKHRRHALSSST